ncbi:MAG: hypothetical protein ACD_12C00017G0002 [uncultured bacterium]|nr:MAG: hypothetical protein ACD_12C00017G0002 [uncultured bacterium]
MISQGSFCSLLRDRFNLKSVMFFSTTKTSIVSPTVTNEAALETFSQEISEIWIRPSTPSTSQKTPNSEAPNTLAL